MVKFKKKPFDATRLRKSKAIPDQSMSVQELFRRYVKGIPADVVQRPKVYIDQDEQDLEKLSRLGPTDRALVAQEMRMSNEQVAKAAKEELERRRQEKERAKNERNERELDQPQGAGIDNLDNTMPDDTSLNPRPLPKRRSGGEGGGKKQ